MKIEDKISDRFQHLINQEISIMATQQRWAGRSQKGLISEDQDYVDFEITKQWGTSCLYLLGKVFGENSNHYSQFNECYKGILDHTYGTRSFRFALAILKSAKDDFENNYLFDTRTLIEAEVFDDFLEQAEHLFSQTYFTAAAVIAGSVLEDSLRKLCTKHGITLPSKPKLDTMNADLAKAGVYNLLKQKQITALADLRNKAAHGQGGFTKEDVEDMIRQVRRFMEDYFS